MNLIFSAIVLFVGYCMVKIGFFWIGLVTWILNLL